MSDEREKKRGRFGNEDSGQDDVEAHKKLHANEEAETTDDDDVEAHVKLHKNT